jgi:DNA-binding XRE family transcriptional regulator
MLLALGMPGFVRETKTTEVAIEARIYHSHVMARVTLPKPDKSGRFPAVEYARIALARDLIRDRKGLGLSQQQLSKLAGVRQETLSRLEAGKQSASSRTVDKICKALEEARRRRAKKDL